MINSRHYERITGYIDESKQAGTRVRTAIPGRSHAEEQRIPMHLVVDPG